MRGQSVQSTLSYHDTAVRGQSVQSNLSYHDTAMTGQTCTSKSYLLGHCENVESNCHKID